MMIELTSSMILAKTKSKNISEVNKINFWGNRLSNINIIRKMPNLQVVSLSINDISTLKDFSFCQKLEEIYIRKNKIADINEIAYLQNLQKLRILWLQDNPCDVVDNYRLIVLKMLPNLKKLDNIEVTSEEIACACKFQMEALENSENNTLYIQPDVLKSNITTNNNFESIDLPSEKNIYKPILKNNEEISDDSFSSTDRCFHCPKECNYNDKSNLCKHQKKPNNLLQAAICLIRELSIDDLILVSREISQRLDKELLPNNTE